ncbi:hypothetical protein [Nitrincola sp.]|uniref:hypothetical protein n=1 Tax=Nitrincola sp. TaxID=1926584 RepID=UPI003A936816
MQKIAYGIVATVFFVAVLLFFYYFHATYFRVNVVFYAAILDAAFATVVCCVGLFCFKIFKVFGGFEKIQLVIIWMLLGYAFAISVPTVIDRSLSFYILEKIQQRGGGVRLDSFEQIFIQEYMQEHRLVDVRLTEQIESGTLVIENDCVFLTSKGQGIASFSRYFRKNWLPKKRLLMGEYNDDLTDPFRTPLVNKSYICSRS